MKRAFVTGGSGFVGRNLIHALRARGVPEVPSEGRADFIEVRALARSEAAAAAVKAAGAEPVRGDLDDEAAMREGARGCDVVFHCAAKVEEWGDPADFHRINVEGTERALRAARDAGAGRFVHVSTEAVLVGGGPIVNADETRPRPARPIGLYPLTKGQAEERVLAANAPGFTTVIVRPRLIWGPGDTSLLAKIVLAVKDGRFMWIGGGHYLTSTCHVANVAEGAILAAERGRPGGIYFLTDGPPIESRAFLTALLATQGVDPGSRSAPRPLVGLIAAAGEFLWRALRLKGTPPMTRTALLLIGEEVTVNDALARRELGYREVISREQGLREMASA